MVWLPGERNAPIAQWLQKHMAFARRTPSRDRHRTPFPALKITQCRCGRISSSAASCRAPRQLDTSRRDTDFTDQQEDRSPAFTSFLIARIWTDLQTCFSQYPNTKPTPQASLITPCDRGLWNELSAAR